jgi:hypothetical protein
MRSPCRDGGDGEQEKDEKYQPGGHFHGMLLFSHSIASLAEEAARIRPELMVSARLFVFFQSRNAFFTSVFMLPVRNKKLGSTMPEKPNGMSYQGYNYTKNKRQNFDEKNFLHATLAPQTLRIYPAVAYLMRNTGRCGSGIRSRSASSRSAS